MATHCSILAWRIFILKNEEVVRDSEEGMVW